MCLQITRKLSQYKDSALLKCLPHLNQKDFDMLRELICQDDTKSKGKETKVKVTDKEDCRRKTCEKDHKENKRQAKKSTKTLKKEPSEEDMDVAARKIQKAYRSHSRKSRRRQEEDIAARKIQKAYRSYSKVKVRDIKNSLDLLHPAKARSDPSIPSTLLRSSTTPAV